MATMILAASYNWDCPRQQGAGTPTLGSGLLAAMGPLGVGGLGGAHQPPAHLEQLSVEDG